MGYYKNQVIVIQAYGVELQRHIEELRKEPRDTRKEILLQSIAQFEEELKNIENEVIKEGFMKITAEEAKDPALRNFILSMKELIKEWEEAQ